MTTLTLPIVVGKKYVRRDGSSIRTKTVHMSGNWVIDEEGDAYWIESGGWYQGSTSHQWDLVADYIEPAKGHPHAALMMEFAKDAQESEAPWLRWELDWGCNKWATMDSAPVWNPIVKYRRKPTVTPDPHAENAAEYAKDMAETDKAWERWEIDFANAHQECWTDCRQHPGWSREMKYRRKEQS